MKKQPRVGTSDALKLLYEWWHNLLDSGRFLKTQSNQIRLDSDLVYLRFQDVEHFQGFRPVSEHDSSLREYFVYTISPSEKFVSVVRDAVNYVLSGDDTLLHKSPELKCVRDKGLLTPLKKEEHERYLYVFDKPSVSLVSLFHEDNQHTCVCTYANLAHPYGEKGSLSENVFKYGRRVFLAPAHQVLLGQKK